MQTSGKSRFEILIHRFSTLVVAINGERIANS